MTSLQKESDCCENCIGYENEWTPENLVCCKEDCMCHSQKESEWGERIKTQIEYLGEEGANTPSFRRMVYEAVESIVVKEISNREKEIAEEVKKLYSLDYMKGSPASYINRALDKVLQIIKH